MKKILNKKCLIAALCAVLALATVLILFFVLGDKEVPERTVYISGDFEYVAIDEHNVEIVGYVGDSKNVSIPTALNGKILF